MDEALTNSPECRRLMGCEVESGEGHPLISRKDVTDVAPLSEEFDNGFDGLNALFELDEKDGPITLNDGRSTAESRELVSLHVQLHEPDVRQAEAVDRGKWNGDGRTVAMLQ
jgi:hypothetical protein